jgi:hypothetical protein
MYIWSIKQEENSGVIIFSGVATWWFTKILLLLDTLICSILRFASLQRSNSNIPPFSKVVTILLYELTNIFIFTDDATHVSQSIVTVK